MEAQEVFESAHKVMQICGQVFRFAVASGLAARDANADLRGALAAIPEEQQKLGAPVATARKTMHERLAQARPLYSSSEAKATFAKLDKGLTECESGLDQLLKMTAGDALAEKAAAAAYPQGPPAKLTN